MLLCDSEITSCIEDGIIGLDPFDPRYLQPTSVDMRLDSNIRVPYRDPAKSYGVLDMAAVPPGHTEAAFIADGGLDLKPGHFVLASTLERLALPNYLAARVEGKSSIARVGLAIHITAGFIDPGFVGQVTLEIFNFSPWTLRLHAGMPIAQVCFLPCSAPLRDYSQTGHYQGQLGPTESRYQYRADN